MYGLPVLKSLTREHNGDLVLCISFSRYVHPSGVTVGSLDSHFATSTIDFLRQESLIKLLIEECKKPTESTYMRQQKLKKIEELADGIVL